MATTKLLSVNPERYTDAALAGIRQLLALEQDAPIPSERIESIKMGTTVATNALLERTGEPTVLVITRGFRDQLRIAYQNRPHLFALRIQLPEPLYARVIEVTERVRANGDVLVPLDQDAARDALHAARQAGFRSVAIVLMHAWRYPEHERRLAEIAHELGFTQISDSHRVSPLMKIVARGETTLVDAYLSPILRRYVNSVAQALTRDGTASRLYFMKSNGGLTEAAEFRGKDAILSGPAGGIVGMIRSSISAGFNRVIGFDMGGTSTDVSHFAGRGVSDAERQLQTMVSGIRITAPMLAIHTVAAGGGSILHFDGQKVSVGPDSAGANPGPACYRRGGPLTVTDCNVLLGKLQPEFFPQLFGDSGDSSIDAAVVQRKFACLTQDAAPNARLSSEQLAEGFLRVAVANMANAIKVISVQRGYDVTQYTLTCFGGAGGQHACMVADELGIQRVFIHPLAGVLSALGIGLSDVSATREQAFEQFLSPDAVAAMQQHLARLVADARSELASQGIAAERTNVRCSAHLKYEGTDTCLVVPATDVESMLASFERDYLVRFSFLMPSRAIVIEALSVEVTGQSCVLDEAAAAAPREPASSVAAVRMYTQGSWRHAQVYRRSSLSPGQQVDGPAILAEENATTIVEPGWSAQITSRNHLVLERVRPRQSQNNVTTEPDPVLLEVFNNLFMSVAEQMGMHLANTAYSVNIKERLDFSCAIFDAGGELIANAPHVPVHLGSMSEAIKTVLRKNAGRIRQGDVYALNDPYHGGTHLPDVTVVMPVFSEQEDRLLFFVAARGHHADIGGITPGSMPPNSRNIAEEGVLIDNFKLVEAGSIHEAEFRELLLSAPYPARNPEQNLADLRAQVAACERGRTQLLEMVHEYGRSTVEAYVGHLQSHAEQCVRRAMGALRDGEFECRTDFGAVIRVRVTVDGASRAATVDFTGTSAELDSNYNAPPAVVHAAVLYVFRTLVDVEIPMNAGCLRPITIIIPEGSMLSPRMPAATVAGNVETSQLITDALYGALNIMAASQGTMNNFTFGDERLQYYETIAGGSGAGNGFDGVAAVQTHMTNSRLTDPEVLEFRYPVLVEEHSIRRGSGGKGRYRGGDGTLRRIRFLSPMTAAILAGRRNVAPFGLGGGADGEVGQTWVERAGGAHQSLSYADQTQMEIGDVFVISTPSGGGFGASGG